MHPVTAVLLAALAASAASLPALASRRWQDTPGSLRPDPSLRTSGRSNSRAFGHTELSASWGDVRREAAQPPTATLAKRAPLSSRALANRPKPTSTPASFVRHNLTLDACETTSDCAGSRECDVGFLDDARPCKGADNCLCLPQHLKACEDSDDCFVPGEVCARYLKDILCASKAAVQKFSTLTEIGKEALEPTPEEEGEDRPTQAGQASVVKELPSNVCIAVHALRKFDPEELVFKQHALAGVLCDGNGSCATPGHMVLVKGKAMMMKSYCDIVPCERRVMYVNSPRHRRGMVIESNTEGLVFTAFAARYETRSEEVIISVAVRLGL